MTRRPWRRRRRIRLHDLRPGAAIIEGAFADYEIVSSTLGSAGLTNPEADTLESVLILQAIPNTKGRPIK